MKKTPVLINCILFFLVIGIIFSSCKKENNLETLNDSNTSPNRRTFAKVLSAALIDRQVREFIKTEALKMFDNDYDLLYQAIKDKKLANGKSFEETLLTFSNNPKNLKEILDNDILLTIYVPQLSNFDAQIWNARSEVPIVAVRDLSTKKTNGNLYAYKQNGEEVKLSFNEEPSVAVVVVKDNERVILTSNQVKDKMTNTSNNITNTRTGFITNTSKGSLSFIDDVFNPNVTNSYLNRLSGAQNLSTVGPYPTRGFPAANGKHQLYTQFAGGVQFSNYVESGKLAAALDKPSQRDFIYYNLSNNNQEGEYEETHVEYIHSISINNNGSKGYIVDEARDWTDGFLELYVTIVFVNRAGNLDQLLKVISVDANALFEKEPNVDKPRVYYLPMPIPIVGWDVYKYGDTWKFFVQEHDPGTETTYSSQVSSVHTSNWKTTASVDGGFKLFKIGFTFKTTGEYGGGSQETKTSTYSLKTTGTSDNLGEGILNFADKVGIGYAFDVSPAHEAHNIYTVNTGFMEIGIVPKLKYQ